MNLRTLFLNCLLCAGVVSLISLLLILKDSEAPNRVTDYGKTAEPVEGGKYGGNQSLSNFPKTQRDLGNSIVDTASPCENQEETTNRLKDFRFSEPSTGENGVTTYTAEWDGKFKGEDIQTGHLIDADLPENTRYIFHVETVEHKGALTSANGQLESIIKDEKESPVQGSAIMIIMDNRITVNLIDRSNQLIYYLYFTGNNNTYKVEKIDINLFPAPAAE